MVGPDDRVFLYVAWPFDGPVRWRFFLETACVADEFGHFAVFVLAAGDAVDLISVHPRGHFAAAFIAAAVRIHRVQKPDTAFEPESPIGQSTDRADINHIT